MATLSGPVVLIVRGGPDCWIGCELVQQMVPQGMVAQDLIPQMVAQQMIPLMISQEMMSLPRFA